MRRFAGGLAVLLAGLLFGGCATTKIDWESRVGHYTFDQAVLELGPPDKDARLTDGTRVSEWLTARGARYSGGGYIAPRGRFIHMYPDYEGPDYYIRLTFDPEGRLTAWRRVAK